MTGRESEGWSAALARWRDGDRRAPTQVLAVALLALLAWLAWPAVPEVPDAAPVAETEVTPAAPGVREFAAAAPGEPETVVSATTDPAAREIPDDDPIFDESRPTEIGFNDTGFPGFSGEELAGMPEPSLALEPLDLGDPLGGVEVADSVSSAAVADTGPRVQALAPGDVAAVARSTPTLHWTLSMRSDEPVELRLVDRETGASLLLRRVAPPVRAGLHALSLAAEGVSLPQGRIVDWSVARVADEAGRGLDVHSTAALRFVPPAGAPAAEPEAQDLAAQGYWIDAFAQLSRRIEAEPGSETLRAQRAALMQQIGLGAL